jgi:Putative peptidoglycan binding domain
MTTPGNFTSLVQQALTNAGFDTQGIDGAWGAHTSAAASAYQTAHGMTPTGLPEAELVRALGVAIPPYPNAADIASALAGLSDVAVPRDALKIMLGESGLNPGPASVAYHDGKPVAGGVFGLLVTQMPDGMSFDDWLALSAAQQIPYAAKFWRSIASKFSLPLPLTARNLYWTNYLPATVVPDAADDYVFVKSNDTYLPKGGDWTYHAGFYTENESLDHPLTPGGPPKGYITAGDMGLAANRGAMNNPATYAAITDALSSASVA